MGNEHKDDRYRKLELHRDRSGKLRAASFYLQEVELKKPKEPGIKHKINLYIDYIADGHRMPMIIDPDIENKGGEPLHDDEAE